MWTATSKSKFQKYLAPGKSGRSVNNSAIIAPIAHISIEIHKNRNQSKRRKETKIEEAGQIITKTEMQDKN
jgi:hypothetical protein